MELLVVFVVPLASLSIVIYYPVKWIREPLKARKEAAERMEACERRSAEEEQARQSAQFKVFRDINVATRGLGAPIHRAHHGQILAVSAQTTDPVSGIVLDDRVGLTPRTAPQPNSFECSCLPLACGGIIVPFLSPLGKLLTAILKGLRSTNFGRKHHATSR